MGGTVCFASNYLLQQYLMKRLFFTLSVCLFYARLPGADFPRERLLMNSGWKFHLGDVSGFEENLINAGVNDGPAKMDFRDSTWRPVNLPHDWAVELPFEQKANGSHGYKPVGPG